MKEKFDVELYKVSVTIGPVENWKEKTTFDIHATTENDCRFSIRFNLRDEFEDSGIFYIGLKGKSNE
jgi:hypothetical protein